MPAGTRTLDDEPIDPDFGGRASLGNRGHRGDDLSADGMEAVDRLGGGQIERQRDQGDGVLGEPIELGIEVIVVLDRFGIERDSAGGSGRFERGDEVVEGHAVDGDGIRGEEVDAEVRGRLTHPCDKRSEGLGGEIAARDEGESTGPSDGLGEFGRRRPTGHGGADDGQRGLREGDRHGSLLGLGPVPGSVSVGEPGGRMVGRAHRHSHTIGRGEYEVIARRYPSEVSVCGGDVGSPA